MIREHSCKQSLVRDVKDVKCFIWSLVIYVNIGKLRSLNVVIRPKYSSSLSVPIISRCLDLRSLLSKCKVVRLENWHSFSNKSPGYCSRMITLFMLTNFCAAISHRKSRLQVQRVVIARVAHIDQCLLTDLDHPIVWTTPSSLLSDCSNVALTLSSNSDGKKPQVPISCWNRHTQLSGLGNWVNNNIQKALWMKPD